jgi:hypothetical protein
LIGREDLGNGEIEDDENDVEIVDCEKFILNHTDRCADSLHSAKLIIDKATSETANPYQF